MNRIQIKRKPGLIKIFSGWIFIFLIPVVVLNLSLKYLFDITGKSNRLLFKETLINELEEFQKELEPREFLNIQFRKFKQSLTQKDQNQSAEQLAKMFFAKTGIRLSALIIHDPECKAILHKYFKASIANEFKNLSRTFTLKFFQFLRLDNSDGIAQNSANLERLKKIAENFFQKQFGLISMIPIDFARTSVSFSRKFSGFCYFYYQPSRPDPEKNSGDNPGWLAIVSGIDIDTESIFSELTRQTGSGVKRSIVFRPINIEEGKKLNLQKISRFHYDEDGLSLVSPIPQSLIAHIAASGSIYPKNIEKMTSAFPFAKLSVPANEVEHPLKRFYPVFRLLSFLFVLTGAIFALRMYLFGLEFNLRLTGKAILALSIAAVLPVALLLVTYLTYQSVERKLELIESSNSLKQKIENISENFSNFINNFHQEAYILSRDVATRLSLSQQEMVRFLAARIEEIGGHEAFLDYYAKPPIHVINPKIPREKLGKGELNVRNIMIQASLRAFGGIKAYNEETAFEKGIDLYKDYYLVDPNFINQTLVSMGRLLEMDQIRSLNSFSLNPIYSSDQKTTTSYLSVKFNQLHMIEEFLETLDLQGNTADVKLQIFVYTDAERKRDIVAKRGKLNDEIRGKIDQARAHGTHYFWWQEKPVRKVHCLYVHPRFPLILMAEKHLPEGLGIGLTIFASVVYLLLLLVFSYGIFAQQLLLPIHYLSLSARKAGRGDLRTRLDYQSEGEFLQLKLAFEKMVDGIAQKEKLSEFVSQEVLETVAKDEIDVAEKVDSTIIFVEISYLDEMIRSGRAVEAIQMLDRCIAEGDRLSKTFGGTLEKVVGNTLMLVFREKETGTNHAINACSVALKLQKQMSLHNIVLNLGIASGKVISGAIGDQQGRVDFTVIGDAVNLAARLKGFASEEPEPTIVIAPSTIRKLKGKGRLEFIKKAPVKGKSREFPIYRLVKIRD